MAGGAARGGRDRLVQPADRRRGPADHRRRSHEAALDQRRAHLAGRRSRRLCRLDAVASQKRTRGRALRRRLQPAARRRGSAKRSASSTSPTPRPQLRWSPDGSMRLGDRVRGRAAAGVRHSGRGRRAANADQGAGGRVRVRVVAGRQEPRLPHARSDAGRRRAPAAGPIVRHPRRRAGSPRRGWPSRRLDATAPRHADAADRTTSTRLSWSPDGREIAYSAAPRSGFTAAVRSARLRRRRSTAATHAARSSIAPA